MFIPLVSNTFYLKFNQKPTPKVKKKFNLFAKEHWIRIKKRSFLKFLIRGKILFGADSKINVAIPILQVLFGRRQN